MEKYSYVYMNVRVRLKNEFKFSIFFSLPKSQTNIRKKAIMFQINRNAGRKII